MGIGIKKGILLFFSVILLLPLIQQCLPFITSGPLFGVYSNAPDIEFSWGKWIDGTYQKGKTDFCNDHVGFRPDLLRLNGQVAYSLFSKIYYSGEVMGSDHFLFFDDYINAYYGKDFRGYKELDERMKKVKALQDTFAHLGKSLILVYAPCKAWYCAEHIPWSFRSSVSGQNNYVVSARIGDSIGIHQIDLNKWFLKLRDTTKEMLYSRKGIHWTNYGSILGYDTMIKYIEQLRHIRMTHPKWLHVEHTTEARDPDNDMGNVANLIFPVVKETYCYPELYYPEDSTTTKPDVIFVGDSYIVNFIRTGVIDHIGSTWQFWFYFNRVFNKDDNDGMHLKIASYDWKAELKKADCIIILHTPIQTNEIGSGFVEAAYKYYFPGK